MIFKLYPVIVAVFLSCQASAGIISETLISLHPDGRSYLQQRSIRSHRDQYDFYVDKSIIKKDFLYVDPADYRWNDELVDLNQMQFDTGSFSLTYTGTFQENVSVDKDGVFTFNSWNQRKLKNGHFGLWNIPENFSRFIYTWVFPENMEIIDYKSNREGQWIKRNNTLSVIIEDDNNITITLRYQERDSDDDSVIDRLDKCPKTQPAVDVNNMGCETDDDQDGVINRLDECLSTVKTARVNEQGCEIDSDQDGVPDGKDLCVGSRPNVMVNTKGCELDSDMDGVINRFDRCLDTKMNTLVDKRGCELDFDGDGVVNSKDKCSHTVKGAEVDFKGCVRDQDKDGITDSKDKCLSNPKGSDVDENGCELDSDRDGVDDVIDQCPDTAEHIHVDFFGCPVDTDFDGVTDSKDLCPETTENAIVDVNGCMKVSVGNETI